MLKNIVICFLFIFSFSACKRTDKQDNKTATIVSDTLKNTQEQKADTLAAEQESDSVVYSNFNATIIKEVFKDSLAAKFSSLETDDIFSITVPKGNINHTKTAIRIFNNAGELLYENIFTTRYLANGYELKTIKNDAEMGEYILSKAKAILALENFTDTSNEELMKEDGYFTQSKEEYENYAVFMECQKEKRPLFSISLGEEDLTYIGYSRKLKKVVDILYGA
ncbi:hypothetical protein [Flavobacterium poyangense]|uniref:hypothetical protein n=1 Tax=Flavobacterium poyangense TaxID=2204302 RepID=UPI0014236DDF|nr:hypothetical protein [Flavobacterium sp. JXAS1]